MSHQLRVPVEVVVVIVDYVADDIKTLQNVAPTCQAPLCSGSPVCLNGRTQHARLASFEELLRLQPRGAMLNWIYPESKPTVLR